MAGGRRQAARKLVARLGPLAHRARGRQGPGAEAGEREVPGGVRRPGYLCAGKITSKKTTGWPAGGGETRRRVVFGVRREAQTSSGKQPARAAATATWVRFFTPSFCMMARTCTLTVPSRTPRERAISLLE